MIRYLAHAKEAMRREVSPGMLLDYDRGGRLIGIEVPDISTRDNLPSPARRAADSLGVG